MQQAHPHYPSRGEVDRWCRDLLDRAKEDPPEATPVQAESYSFQLGVRHNEGNHYVAFNNPDRDTFYGYWQPASAGPAPVLFHLPGYGAEISAHPELVQEGYNVLHINPLGYATPSGRSREDALWPVLPDTVKSHGKKGYVDWLQDAVSAVSWALSMDLVEAERFGFFGTSQGGGTSLLMASLHANQGVRAVAADLPFLINFPMMYKAKERGAYNGALSHMSSDEGSAGEWRALGLIDVLSHAHRLKMPTLLTAGGLDSACPPATIESLFEVLPGTRSYTYLSEEGHRYTAPFLRLAKAWFGLYV